MVKSILLNLRSSDAIDIDSEGRHTFQLTTPILAPENHMIHLSLQSAEIPNSFYNVNSSNNKTQLSETVSGTTTNRSLLLPEANYNAITGNPSLLNAVQTLLNSTGATLTYVVKFSDATGKFTISTATSNASVTFDFSVANSAAQSLGFTKEVHTLTTSTDLVSNRVCDLSGGNHALLIRSDLGGTNVFDTGEDGARTSTIFTIPITAPNFGIISYKPNGDEFKVMIPRQRISNFYLRITNQDKDFLNFNGASFSMAIRFDFVQIMHALPTQGNYGGGTGVINENVWLQVQRTETNLRRLQNALSDMRDDVVLRRDELIQETIRRTAMPEENVEV